MKTESIITINVTEKHLKNGKPNDCAHCPVAEALLEQIPGAESVEVDTDKLRIRFDMGNIWSCWTPDIAAENIERIDNGARVEPFSFEMTNPLA